MTNFVKANIQTGDMIETRSGKRATVMLNTPIGNILRFHTTKDSFSYLDTRYNDDLTHNKYENLDIVKVYRIDPSTLDKKKVGDLIANPDKMTEYGKVVYDRDYVAPKPTIADLQTGDMLVHRGGKVSTVYKDTPVGDIIRFHTEFNSFSYLTRYNDDLNHESKDSLDIIAVFRVSDPDTTKAGDFIGNPVKMLNEDNLLWFAEDTFAASYVYGESAGQFLYRDSVDTEYDEEDIDV
jgi:hypothetical protein